jgi:EAL domain-containing protein (putative c-di-GMP-specific phosphodiesterase class I)
VKNAFTLNQLKEIGIDYAQGFYLDKLRHINKKVEDLTRSMQQRSAMH